MKRGMSDWAHLIRLTMLFASAGLAFAAVRPFFVPDTFGDLGHYRAAALEPAREYEVIHAGRAACVTCHTDVNDAQTAANSKHLRLSCEGCHGALARHAADPTALTPTLPDAVPLCTRCHESTAGRPSFVPQVVIADHSGGEACTTCHTPHVPGM